MGLTVLCTRLSLSLLLYSLTLSLIGFSVIPLWHTWTTMKELLKDTPAQRFFLAVAPARSPPLPPADAAHSLGIHGEARSRFPSLPVALLSPRLESALE